MKFLTGLHIGGTKESVEIGGLDNPVIKTIDGKPYILLPRSRGKFAVFWNAKMVYGDAGGEG